MKSYLGLDIGSANIKIVEAAKEGKGIKILNAASSPSPARAFLSEAEEDQEEVARAVKSLIRDSAVKTQEVYTSILESQVFTRIIETPKLSERELSQSLRWEAEQYIPLPLNEVNMDFVVLEKNEEKEKMQVLLVAAPLTLIEKYVKIFEMAGLEIKALESEGVGLYRLYRESGSNVLLLNLGASNTSFYLLKQGILVLARSIGSGSAVLTKALTSELNLPLSQAEEYKKTYGLDASQMEGKIASLLKPLVSALLDEISQSLNFFKEKYPEEVISRIVLTGGGSLLPGLTSYFQEKLQIEVSLANPWQKFVVAEKVKSQLGGQAAVFSVATGAAVREILT